MYKKRIIQSERLFHDTRFSLRYDPRAEVSKYYKAAGKAKSYFNALIKKYAKQNSRLLEYGCGTGGNIEFFYQCGYKIEGIDISSEGIKKANQESEERVISAKYYVMDAHKTRFHNNRFDVIVGTGILHHLSLVNALAELRRILRINGHAIFFEPMGYNFFINIYRRLTPNMRSTDEHPLTMTDLKLMNKFFDSVEIKYFVLCALASILFVRSALFGKILKVLNFVDEGLFHILPFLKKYAWIVVIDLSKPKKVVQEADFL